MTKVPKTLFALLTGASALTALPAMAATLTVARGVDADGLDPQQVSTTQSSQITNLMFDTLVTLDASGVAHPGLAESWEISDDNLSYAFTISEGITCHDGSAFTPEDVVFTFDRARDPETKNPRLAQYGPIESATAEGNVVTVTMTEPYGPFMSYLGSFSIPMMCQSSVTADGGFEPVGTGPFKLVDWSRNDHITLAANDTYQNYNPLIENPGRPYVDELKLVVIPEAVARMAALRSGEVDLAEPSLEEAALLDSDPAFKVYSADLSGQQVLTAFTWKIPPLDNPDVRRAIGMGLDRDSYAMIAYEGLVSPTTCPAAPGLIGVDLEKCAEWGGSYDPDAAREILEGLGYTQDSPLEVKLSVHALPGFDQMHQMMQQNLAEIGVKAELETREVAAFFDHMSQENMRTEGTPVVWTMGYSGVDSDYMTTMWKTPGFVNMGLGGEMDAMLDEQRTLTGDARVEKLQEIQKILLEEGYAVPLVSPGWNWLWASSDKIDGFKTGFVASILFNDVKIAE